jgi:nitrite reductase/ring-hydroxylating ferredoxin subunit
VRLEYRKDGFLSASGKSIVCYAHGAQFDPLTGACTDGACQGQRLRQLHCQELDGWLWAAAP